MLSSPSLHWKWILQAFIVLTLPIIQSLFMKVYNTARVRSATTLRMSITEQHVKSYDGLNIEVLKAVAQEAVSTSNLNHYENAQNIKPPIIFLHGSYHSAWCYRENFMPYFSKHGFDCYVISFRGTAPTGLPIDHNSKTVSIESHILDTTYCLNSIISDQQRSFPNNTKRIKPILIAHSFGGLVAMKLLEDDQIRARLSGIGLLCSVPPSGNGPMTLRFMKRNIFNAFKITYAFVFKALTLNSRLCKEVLFDLKTSNSVTDDQLERYMEKIRADSEVSLDVAALGKVLPSKTSMDPSNKRASWLSINSGSSIPSRIVIGSENDFIVDIEGNQETARYLGVEPVILSGLYHDLMLGNQWEKAAHTLREWIEVSVCKTS